MTKKERNNARGQNCTLRIAGTIGCASTETTVLAHAPCRDKGMGFKSPDWWAAFSCDTCHAIIDGRLMVSLVTRAEINAAWLRGIYETQKIQRQSA